MSGLQKNVHIGPTSSPSGRDVETQNATRRAAKARQSSGPSKATSRPRDLNQGTRGLARLEWEAKQEEAARLSAAREHECEVAATYRRKFGPSSVSGMAFDLVIEEFRNTPKGAGAIRRAVDAVSDNLSELMPETVDLSRSSVKQHAIQGIRWAQKALRETMGQLYGNKPQQQSQVHEKASA